jgi:hypothetical protein
MRPPERWLALAVAASGLAAPAHAQQQVVLQFRPEFGRMVRTLTEINTSTKLVGFPAVPDGAVFEDERRVNATQRVVRLEEGGALVEVTVDSVRERIRQDAEAWRDVVDPGLVGDTARAIVSPRFSIVGIRSQAPTDGDVLQALGAYVAGLGFAFPETPLRVGESFETGGRLRARVTTDSPTGIPIDEVVFGDLALTLDSVVTSEGEELSFLHFRGPLTARTSAVNEEGGDVVTAFSGAYAGRLVWSAAWGAFVSGALRVRVDARIHAERPSGAVDATATWDRTIVHQVRP